MTLPLRLTAALTAAIVVASAPAWAATPCDRLAARARALPAQAWSAGSGVLKPWLQIDEEREPRGPLETQLTRDPAVRQAIGAQDGEAVFIDRLAGADLYAVSTVQGTLHCQNTAFVRAAPGGKPRIVEGPSQVLDKNEDELCWTRSGEFGRVFGQPAFLMHGANGQRTDDEDILIVPWSGERWGKGCALQIRYRNAFRLDERRCRDAAVCAAADSKVLGIVAAYDRHLQAGGSTPFRYGTAKASSEIKAAAEAERRSTEVPEWPGFGKDPDSRSLSYEGLAYFPLTLAGHAYLGAISHEGVGWRGGNTALLVVYRLEKGRPQAGAAYAVDRVIAGLREASARP